MSDTVLEHPLVRWYLHELDKASLTLPATQARELREQIAAHLAEAVPPGATDEEILDEIGRLGTVRSLAAAAAGPAYRSPMTRLRIRLTRVRWWTWVSAAVIAGLAGSGLGYLLLALNAPPLAAGSVTGWYYLVDRARSVQKQAADATQYTVPERFRQEQGLIITVVNNSDWTQTVVGIGPQWSPFTSHPIQTAVGSGRWADVGSAAGPISWSSPGSIPPHSQRMLRVLWHTDYCMPPDGGAAIQEVPLTVRVGIFTRTEVVPLSDTWEESGIKRTQCH